MTKFRISERDARERVHDFNNLLTAIIGAADAILERSDVDTETRVDVTHIREGARRGANLVRGLNAGAADASVQVPPVSISETIRATSRLLAHRLGAAITLTLALEESDARARIEPSQLDRVLLNLVANARHAMPNGGAVTISTGRRVVAESHGPGTIPPGDYATITVTDTGCGIPAEELPRIFDAGYTSHRHSGGAGMGLASVQDITRRAGGFLAVESVKGRGTRFEIYLPRESTPTPPVGNCSGDAARTVLLVEDDLLVRQVAQRVLSRAGWAVLVADSAEQALGLLETSHCDLMISDVAMPGMDGVALTRLALARQPGLPVILTSGYERPDAKAGVAVGTVGFLTKPYGQADLLAAVEQCLQRNVGEQLKSQTFAGRR